MAYKVAVRVLEYEGNKVRTFDYDGEQWVVIRDAEAILGNMREVLRLKMRKYPRIRRVYVEVVESAKKSGKKSAKKSANCQKANCQLSIGGSEVFTGYVEEECAYGPYSLACVNGFGLVNVVKTRRKERFKEFARCVLSAGIDQVPTKDRQDRQKDFLQELEEVRYELHIVQGTQRIVLPVSSEKVWKLMSMNV